MTTIYGCSTSRGMSSLLISGAFTENTRRMGSHG